MPPQRPSVLAAGEPWLWGVVACVVAAVAAGLAYGAVSPLFSSGDEAAHVDYAYQVWRGALPVFGDGLTIQPPFGFVPPVQWVSQHPPLYYLLQAPVVGPLIDAGDYVGAGYAGRAVNALLAGTLVVAVVWACAQLLPGRRHLWVVAAMVTAADSWVVRVGGSIYNDLLAALCVTLLLGVSARILRAPRTGPRLLVALSLAGAAALSTRAALAVVLLVCWTTLAVRDGIVRRSARALAGYAVAALGAVLPSAWFYLRNLTLTGSLLGGDPEWARAHLELHPRTLWSVVTDLSAWGDLVALFSFTGLPRDLMTFLLVLAPLALLVVVRLHRGHVGAPGTATPWLVALLIGSAVAVLALQMQYATGGSGLNARYLLPIVLPLTVGVSLGLVAVPRASPVLVAAWAITAAADLTLWLAHRPVLEGSAEVAAVHPRAAWAALGVMLVMLAIAWFSFLREHRLLLALPRLPRTPAMASSEGLA